LFFVISIAIVFTWSAHLNDGDSYSDDETMSRVSAVFNRTSLDGSPTHQAAQSGGGSVASPTAPKTQIKVFQKKEDSSGAHDFF
jgi:hypothetical protein